MGFEATNRTPKTLGCTLCIFSDVREVQSKGLVAEIPYKAKKIKERIHHLHYLIVTDNSGNTIVRHRQEKDIWQSLCDYPCMEMESEKQPSRRSIEDELL